ncbi:MAG: CTP pyrophosphohydrolase [Synergistetes bacterium ADurb.BinA166]|nr:MAG: CTP pyrophosphohydrolase [Synergistetes bacterium ADurb.BinA166]
MYHWDVDQAPLPRAVCLLLRRADGLILAVSRKGDRTKFGLPGGKVDPGETDEEALVREVREETGLVVINPGLLLSRVCKGETDYLSKAYYAREVSGEIGTSEPIDIQWVAPEILLAGPFGEFNEFLFRHVGIM